MTPPNTDDEWRTHVLNIHGTFFERWCESTILSEQLWKVRSFHYPVVFQQANQLNSWQESNLDIWSETNIKEFKLNFLIECKKNNPDYTHWVFYRKSVDGRGKPITPSIKINKNTNQEWVPQLQYNISLQSEFDICDDARETKSKYTKNEKDKQKTKTSNASITEAAFQISLACQAIAKEENSFLKLQVGSKTTKPPDYSLSIFVPIIVTTAKLFICEFNSTHVSPTSGEIDFNKVKWLETDELVYEYPLPKSLQMPPLDLLNASEQSVRELFSRRHIIIIQSNSFQNFLRKFK